MHIPVLSQEVIHYLNPQKGDAVIDCTLGLGGHAAMILEHIGHEGLLIGIDRDEENLAQAKINLRGHENVYFVRDNFENISEIVFDIAKREGKPLRIDKIVFDLGLSSRHVDTPERGFSFLRDGPLDMRFDTRQKLTASDIVNNSPLAYLLHIFKTYGEEPHASRIARAIVTSRKSERIATTTQLARLVEDAVRFRGPRGDRRRGSEHGGVRHPATRVFQALRIAVNRELEAVENALLQAMNLVSVGGRIVVISFHSLEDRIVKNIFKEKSLTESKNKYPKKSAAHPPPMMPSPTSSLPRFTLMTKKPITPAQQEIEENPRSRSAKLRAVARIS